jgi:uncharacterized metal-binding protein
MACGCGNEKERNVIITACSGAANVGLLADRVARGLRAESVGSMICMAALGADLSGYVESARNADLNVVIEGCPVGCGKKIHEKLGIKHLHLVMTDFGAEKGKTVITDELVAETVARAKAAIAAADETAAVGARG